MVEGIEVQSEETTSAGTARQKEMECVGMSRWASVWLRVSVDEILKDLVKTSELFP